MKRSFIGTVQAGLFGAAVIAAIATLGAPAQAAEVIRCAYPFWFGFAPVPVAIAQGYFAEEGLEVTTVFDNDRANVMPGLERGDLDCATLSNLVRDVIRELARHGARRLCLLDGHYENQWFLTEGIDLALREVGAAGVRVMRFEYWDFVSDDTLARVFPDGFPGVALEHAAVMETSLMLHWYPAMVRQDLIPDNPAADFPPYDIFPPHRDWVPASGALTSAKAATADKGRLMAEQYIESIVAAVRREFP